MNGLSDARLTLYAQELEQERYAPISVTPAMPGNRWDRFWMRLHTRRRLLELDERALKDIGLTREQARAEALKPFWKV